MGAVGYTSGDPSKVDVAGDTMTGPLVLDDGSPAASLDDLSGVGGGTVTSVNGDPGPTVVLDAADVGAETPAGATGKVNAHTGAMDPHGDRAYATGAVQDLADATTTALAGKVSTGDSRLTDARTPTAHAATHAGAGSDPVTLAQSQITGLTAALAAKVDTGDSRLTDARTPTAHAASHGSGGSDPVTPAAIGAVPTTQLGAASGVATLDSGGKLTTAQIPAISIVDYLGAVGSQAAMLALTGQQGDWCTRTDLGTTWIITGSNPALLAGWTQLSYPTAPVTSVNGSTGAVVLNAASVSAVPTTRSINPGTGLTGGGDLSADRTLTVAYGTSSTTAARGDDARLSDARTPTGHAASHASGGSDPVTPAAIGAVQRNVLVAADHSAVGWNFPPYTLNNSQVLATAGTAQLMKVPVGPGTVSITNVVVNVLTAGATLTSGQCFAAVYSSAGVLLGTTADQATAWQSTGLKTMPIAGGAVTASGYVYVALWANGTTLPAFSMGLNGQAGLMNFNVSGFNLVTATAANMTGLTTTSPGTTGALTSSNRPYWVALT